MRIRHTLVLASLSLLAATGCGESIDSPDVNTSGIWADFEAVGKAGSQTEIHTDLKTGGPNSNTYLELMAGDKLVYIVDGSEESPRAVDVLGQYTTYEKTVSKNENGMNIKVEFRRPNGTSAKNSSTQLPKKFSIESPSQGASVSRANDDLQVQISNTDSTAATEAEVTGDCLEQIYDREVQGGSVTFPAGTFKQLDDDDAEETCTARLTVTREREGSVDSAFDGGEFPGQQVRTTTFETQP